HGGKIELLDLRYAVKNNSGFVRACLRSAGIDKLFEQSSHVEIDSCGSNLLFGRINLIDTASGQIHWSIRGCMTLERTFVTRFKGEFRDDAATPVDHISHDVAVSGKGGDERPNELLANGRLSVHASSGNLNRNVFGVVRHYAVLVGPAPRVVIFEEK